MTPWSDKRSQDGCRDCGAFFLDFVGLFDRDRVQVRWSDSRRPTNEQIENAIEAAWAEQTRLADEQGRRLYNGTALPRDKLPDPGARASVDPRRGQL